MSELCGYEPDIWQTGLDVAWLQEINMVHCMFKVYSNLFNLFLLSYLSYWKHWWRHKLTHTIVHFFHIFYDYKFHWILLQLLHL